MPSAPTARQIRDKLCNAAFGDPLVSNIYRGLVAEIIVDTELGALWNYCGSDWRSWDFEHVDGCRLEVKQSAARQTWTRELNMAKPIFDIRARKGYFEGTDWIGVADPRRFADIYVFAYHPIMDATADHRDPLQWQFYVVPANRLPKDKRSASLEWVCFQTQYRGRAWGRPSKTSAWRALSQLIS